MIIANKIDMTVSAAKRITQLLADEPQGSVFRIAVDGGGCSGFQYRFAIDSAPHSDDKIFRKDEAMLAIDEISLDLLAGAQLDFVETLAGAHFEVKNPQSKSSCGCGNSFSIA